MSDAHPETIGERYRVVRVLGAGGMGAVYEAVDTSNGVQVAIKVIIEDRARKPQDVTRFEREAKAAAAIHSPHIVEILDTGVDVLSSLPYIAMELLEGEDLADLLRRVGPIPVDLAVRVGAQAAAGLAAAHEARIVHRDIKPANLFLSKVAGGKRVVKLVDFGIAKIKGDGVRSDGPTAGLTKSGGLLGSPLYMSPEQARGKKNIDEASDVWSLGVVLYHALTGSPPHADTDELGDLIIRICSEPADPVQDRAPWVPPEVAAIVHRALRFAPDERFRSAREMRDALTALLSDDGEIDEASLQPLDDDERNREAPRLAQSVPDAPQPRARASKSAHGDSPHGRSMTTLSLSSGSVQARSTAGEIAAGSTGTPPRSWARKAAPVALVAAVLGAILVARQLGGRGDVGGAAPSASPRQPSPALPELRTVRLVVIPSEATVDVEGSARPSDAGLVVLRGAVGSVHRVHVSALGAETTADVVITESGPVPAKVEVPRASAPGSASAASPPPPTATAAATPGAAARPRSSSPAEIRTKR